MASTAFEDLARQVKTLTKKNLVLLVTRHWISTLFQALLIPVAVYALILNIDNYKERTDKSVGQGIPRPIRSIQESIPETQQLVIIKPHRAAADIDRVIKTISVPLSPDKVAVLDGIESLQNRCEPNIRGVSGCYSIVVFHDSPLTAGANQTWNYTLQFDQAREGQSFDVHRGDNAIQLYQLPVQLAIDNAITNSTTIPDQYIYTWKQEEVPADVFKRLWFADALITTYIIAFFLGALPGIYHAVGFVTRERADGVSHLIDAMGGGAAARVVASVLALSTVQLLGWVLAGVLYGKVVFYESNTAIFIFWQIFSGLALVTASVMAAAFFRTRRISGVFAAICFTCLAGGAAVILNRRVDTARVVVLAIMFPSMNYIFALAQMARYITISQPVHLSKAPPALPLNSADWVVPNTFFVPIWAFWVISILHIAIYPLLAIWAERWMHGISFKGRVLSDAATTGSLDPDIAVRTEGLTKVYPTVWYKKIFRVDDGTGRVALSNLDLVARNTQIVCLLGVNGAGKSTTLDLLSGFHTLTSGSMHIRARPSQLGVCPQKNVLFDRLTVLEHVRFWSQLKGAGEEENTLHALIEACDLSGKANIQARVLSGGQKRKLQLACMFVGDTKVCLMDEVTTGLDPISRRAIWNIILAERAKRSMIFTTHFLDEGEVLADHIVILSKGEIKCQGSGAELKTRFGGGYRVYLPQDADVSGVAIDEPRRIHQDHAVYRTPDSTSAARLVARLEAAGHSRVRVAGPTVEDVFLRVAEEDVLLTESDDGGRTDAATNEKSTATEDLTPGKPTTFWAQVRILLLKRWLILPRYWVGAFLVLALPIAGMPPINSFIALEFERPRCSQSGKESVYDQTRSLQMWMGLEGSQPAPKPFGPPSANETLYRVIMNFPIGGAPGNVSGLTVSKNWALQSDFESFRRFTENSPSAQGAVWMGDATSRPTIGNSASFVSSSYPLEVLRLYTSMASGVEISSAIRSVSRYFSDSQDFSAASWKYMLYACVIFTAYPAFFALYPAFERLSNVRTLQCTNGVRPLPIWMAYFLFDVCFVLAIAIAYTATITVQFPYWGGSPFMFVVVLLHGMCGTLISYIVSIRASSQLSAFLWSLFLGVLPYFGIALSYTLPLFMVDALYRLRITDIVSYVLGIFFPIANVFRSIAYGFNYARIGCRDQQVMQPPGSWWGYGFPITYLAIQFLMLAALLVWLDSDLSFSMFRLRGPRSTDPSLTDQEDRPSPTATSIGVEKEAVRVQVSQADDDLLRLVHVTKTFNSTPAVDDVSLGLRQNEILALLGPNGAGKTTIVNMIRGDLRPSSGRIILPLPAPSSLRRPIGVCPQFDALDLLTARQHLIFYARIHGTPAPRAAADAALSRVGLASFADTQAAQLSGGNRRKLSLAIALMGDPAVLLLDEPSSAMDAAAKRQMWKVLAEAVAPGRSILLTTHSMEEADALATRAAILSRGRLKAVGTTQTLRERYSNLYNVDLVLSTAPHPGAGEMERVEEWVRGMFAGARFEEVNVGGQVKFVMPVDEGEADGPPKNQSEGGGDVGIRGDAGELRARKGTGVGRVIEILEHYKAELGLQDYSIGAPTLERVFLSVVKDDGDEEELQKRKPAWRRFLGLA